MVTYKLNYTIWNNDKTQHIKDDIVQFPEPKAYNDILSGLWVRWAAIRGDTVQVGDCDIELLSNQPC
jgi:hypothetical protein